MPGFIANLGMQAAQQATGAGMGLLLGAHERKQQVKQQQKLQALQIQGQKEMADYNFSKQLQMWKDTNYGAQVEQMKQAGLSPGLIYGMSGGGATTTGGGGTGVTGGQAAPMGPAAGMGIAMGNMQLQLLDAQKKNIDADTANKQAQTTKTSGVDTALAETTIDKLKQDISSAKTQQALTEVQTAIASIDEYVRGKTQNMEISKIADATRIIANDATISDATRDTVITTIKRQSLQVYLENQLLQSQKVLVDEQTNKTRQEIKNLIQQITASQKQMQLEDLRTRIMETQAFRNAQDRGDINIDDITKNVGVLLNPTNILKAKASDIGFKIPQK